MADTPILSVQNLNVAVRHNHDIIVRNVGFDIHPGEVFALVGESGSGKSITALSVMRLLPQALKITHGTVVLQGENVFALPEQEMNAVRGKKFAMIFQEPQTSLNPVQTIGAQLHEVLKLHKNSTWDQALPQLVELLNEVGIPDPETRLQWYPHQLSGGQKQRVMIAMALACEPDLLIADEPTTALDVTIQKQVLALIKELCKKRNLAVLLITHDMGVVSEMADTVAVMKNGEIIEADTVKEFFQAPKTAYSRQLIASLPDTEHFNAGNDHKVLLSAKDVNVWFPIKKGVFQRTVGYTKAVEGVSFTVEEGQTLALVGESGCGKTSIAKAAIQLNPVSAGSIEFNGKNISELSGQDFLPLRKDIQIIFQDPFSSMNPRMTVRQIIEEGMVSLGVELDVDKRRTRILDLLTKVGLEKEHLDRYPHEFSGGQRQRIAIARALAVEPKLIICDEPTSALDVSIRGQILQLLKKLQDEENISFLFITHDLSLIPALAHKVAVMRQGKIVEQGTAEQIMTAPKEEYTKELLAAAPKLPEHISL